MVYALTSPADHEIPPDPRRFSGIVAELVRELEALGPEQAAEISGTDLRPFERARNVVRSRREYVEKLARQAAQVPWVPDGIIEPTEDDEPIRGMRLGKARYAAYRSTLLGVCPWCTYCGRALTEETATLDHVLPKSKGGENYPGNLVLACEGCNAAKGSDTPAAWAFRILTATSLPGQIDELLGMLARLDDAEAEAADVVAFRLPAFA